MPEKYPEQGLTAYIYKNEVVLLVPLRIPEGAVAGTVQLKANVSWLECETSCIPGDAEVSGTLDIGPDTIPSDAASVLKQWQERVPPAATNLAARAWWNDPGRDDIRTLMIELSSASVPKEVDFYPYASETFEVQGNTSREGSDPGKVRLKTTVKRLSGEWPSQVSGVLVSSTGSVRQGVEVVLNVEDAKGPAPAGSAASTGVPVRQPLGLVLLYAFLGGMILNIMPCVLPVIALKILGFVGQARENPARVRFLGLVYGVGVLASFLVLAALVIGVRAAGQKAGWGMQFGNPQFLVILTVLVTLVALNLFGLFEVTLSGRAMTAADSLASQHGAAGAFFNGVLATALATPCTAPFLSIALGFAFTQSSFSTVLVFLTIGLGLAFPYVLLSWNPVWLKFVPKPGVWMEHFKVAMGFPLLATAFWLFSLIPIHYGDRSWWLGIFLVFLAVAVWIYGQFVQRGRSRRGLAAGIALAVAICGYFWAAEAQLNWRSPAGAGSSGPLVQHNSSGVQWQPWSREAVASARAAGRPVLVDFTAKWCLTCNTVVKPALESKTVSTKLKELNAVALIGDYTKFPPAITDELNRYGRAGVPLVLVYPPDPSKDALVLPEALTPGMVVDGLERAVQQGNGS